MNDILDLIIRASVILAIGQGIALLMSRASAWMKVLVLRLTAAATILAILAWVGGVRWMVPVLPAEPVAAAPITGGAESLPSVVVDSLASPAAVESVQSFPWPLAAWGAGFALMAIGICAGWVKLRRLKGTASPLANSGDADTLQAASQRRVHLGRQNSLATALTFGLARHTVLVPGQFESWDETTRRSVLLHEAAHIRRLDCAWNVAALGLRAVLWFHPLAWTLARFHRTQSELAADQMAISLGVAPTDYAESLLAVAANTLPGAPSPQGAITMNAHPLARRITEALKPARRFSSTGAMALIAVLSGAFLAAATTFAGPKEGPAPAKTPDQIPAVAGIDTMAPDLTFASAGVNPPRKAAPAKRAPDAAALRKKRDELRARRNALRAKAKDPEVRRLLNEIEALEKEVQRLERMTAPLAPTTRALGEATVRVDGELLRLPLLRDLPLVEINGQPLAPLATPGTRPGVRAPLPPLAETRPGVPLDTRRVLAPLAALPGQPIKIEGDTLIVGGRRIPLPKGDGGAREIKIVDGKVFVNGKEISGVRVPANGGVRVLRESPSSGPGARRFQVEGEAIILDGATGRYRVLNRHTELAKELEALAKRMGSTMDPKAKEALAKEMEALAKALERVGSSRAEVDLRLKGLSEIAPNSRLRVEGHQLAMPKVTVKDGVVYLDGKRIGVVEKGKPVEVTIVNGVVTINGKKVEETKEKPDKPADAPKPDLSTTVW